MAAAANGAVARGRDSGTPRFAHVAVLSNPNARQVRRRAALLGSFERRAQVTLAWTGAPTELRTTLAGLALGAGDLLVINGGDGTVQSTLTALSELTPLHGWPTVAVLPGGTTNMTAFDISGRVGYARALAALLRAIDAPEQAFVRRRHVLRLRTDGAPTRYGFAFGAGAMVNGVQYCRDQILRRGAGDEWASGLTLLRGGIGIALRDPRFTGKAQARIEFHGPDPSAAELDPAAAQFVQAAGTVEEITGAWLILLGSTLDRMIMGIHPYWGDRRAPLHFTWIRSDARNFLGRLPQIVTGGWGLRATDGYASRDVESVDLDLDGQYMIDGEVFAAPTAPLSLAAVGPVGFVVLR